MLIFLYGQDTYRLRQKLREVINHYKETDKSGLNLIFLEGANLKFEDFKDITQQISMFNEKKLLIVENVFSNQEFKEKFLKNRKEFLKAKKDALIKIKKDSGTDKEDVVLFCQEEKISSKDKFFDFLKTEAKTQSFDLLKGEKLKRWIKEEFSKFEKKISQDALNKLADSARGDLWLLSNEIKKLAFFKKEENISLKDVELLVKSEVETAIFKTIDAISQKDRKKALFLIHQHLEKGDNPLYLLSMVSFQFRNILIIKDLIEKNRPYYSILKTISLHPFVVRKSFQQANEFTFAELKKIHQKIFQADLDIKTGRIEPETALDLLIAEI